MVSTPSESCGYQANKNSSRPRSPASSAGFKLLLLAPRLRNHGRRQLLLLLVPASAEDVKDAGLGSSLCRLLPLLLLLLQLLVVAFKS